MSEMTNQSVDEDQNIRVEDILITLGRERRTFGRVTVAGLVVTILVTALFPSTYVARTVILPPQQQSSMANTALSQLGAIGGIAGSAVSVKTPDEMYVALIKSRSVQDALIQTLELQKYYKLSSIEATRQMLGSQVSVSNDKRTGFISIEAEDKDPNFAAKLANAHTGELRKLLARLALTDAQQRRLFFEHQVSKTKNALNAAEINFRQAQAASGLVVTQALAESGVKESAQLRTQIAIKEVQLRTQERFATDKNPEVQRTHAEVAALRNQLKQLEQGSGKNNVKNKPHGLLAVQAFRDMKIQEGILESLIKQLELARADEAKDGPLLQQIDMAVPPEHPNKPNRKVLFAIGFLGSILLGVAAAFAKNFFSRNSNSLKNVMSAWSN